MPVPYQARGAYTALATPFHDDHTLDLAAFRKLVEFQIAEGITGLVPCGTTGESPTLSWEEHTSLVRETVHVAHDRVPVLAGAGSNNTAEAIEATQDARASGASAVLLVDCYYNGPSSLELRTEYYERILASVSDIPVVPYVIPGRSGCALSAEDLALLHLTHPTRVPAVKEATADFERMRRERALAGPSLAILSGDDDLTLTMMRDAQIGGAGVISVMSNLAPRAVTQLVDAQARGDAQAAGDLAEKLTPLFRLVTVQAPAVRVLPDGRRVDVVDKFRNPVAVKAMMAGLGMLGPAVRAPLGKMTRAAVDACRNALREVHTRSPEILAPIAEAYALSIEQRLADDRVWERLAR